jgi:N-acetylglucosamine kinase-like BadF-type ATPase
VRPWVLGIDSGGSGLRVALAPADPEAEADEPLLIRTTREPVRTGPAGIDADHFLAQAVPLVRGLAASVEAAEIAAAAIGATGMASLGGALRERLPVALREALGVGRLALAADAVTAYAGALGTRPGVAVAAGTGLIALGTGGGIGGWRRADGWGHLLGDCGSGAWIGRAGLEAALRAHDGRAGGSVALLERMTQVFGAAPTLPGLLYPRDDRAAVLASFAPEVGRCAAHDPVAAEILRQAARHILEAAAAVRPGDEIALTGGLFRMGEPLLAPLRGLAPQLVPGARLVSAEGDPLRGAVRIAVALASGGPMLPTDPRLLTVD